VLLSLGGRTRRSIIGSGACRRGDSCEHISPACGRGQAAGLECFPVAPVSATAADRAAQNRTRSPLLRRADFTSSLSGTPGGGCVMRKLGLIAGAVLAGVGLVGPLQGVADAQTGKLVVIVLENEPYASIAGNSQAPYLNQLIAQGKLFTDYAGVADGSNPNYLAMTSGLTSALSPPAANVCRAIDASGGSVSWKEFMESMPGNCADGNS